MHSKIILSQRTIQGQIDNLLQQNEIFNEFNNNIYAKLSKQLLDSSETLTEVSSKMKTSATELSFSQLTYRLGMSSVFLDKTHALMQLQQNNLK